ncbi:energy-coupling factor transport system ATP-binding protein [Isoptericola sp. CG 20/1183]|uniref:Energy-coupling factor transport system ATP-binding protein n=1 Tax=Isoptericola halotolerans TaxID=300560 RepID=A0ABX5EIH4_9MICO|nr:MULTISPECIES: ATP-binding cassette domain-containing protein [Isoptericola]PRZ09485.1 energy-coupling factor transport system ATP-binding protein [Isoptericola sp. CG 20/1183]PRZ10286.1 energy-coupling factor transport system ATP-binding protein [Isoptericola halotolerans]
MPTPTTVTAPGAPSAPPSQAAAAVEVRGLTFRYPGAEQDSLRGVDLRIAQGDFVAVVGGNGSGKTTLCKAFNGLVPHFWNGDLTGSVEVFGRDTAGLGVAELGADVGYVFQDFGNQLVRPTVRDDVGFAPLNLGHADWAERADRAMAGLDLTSIGDTFTWQLSGGQQHLTALAGALALAPRLLVVDEPAAEVDPARATALYEHLARLNRERGVTVVVIEHHAELVARYARSVVLMADGAPRWHLPVREALGRVDDLAEADIPVPQVIDLARRLAPGTPRLPLTVEECTTLLSSLPSPPVPLTASATVPRAAVRDAPPVATVAGVTHGYRTIAGGRSVVLDDLHLSLHDGEKVALVGSNGAGKSTLLALLAGLTLPRDGTVEVDGRDTRRVSAAELSDAVCYLVQHPEEMFLADSVRGDVAMHPRGRRVPDADTLVEEVLERVRLTQVADRDGRLLSGGQQRRAALAVALAMRPRLLLLDEPTSSLDLRSRDDVIAMLAALAAHIRCTVVATHDMHLVAEWADRVVVLDGGRVLADTDPATLFASPEILSRARLVPPQVSQVGAALGMAPVPLSVDELVERAR